MTELTGLEADVVELLTGVYVIGGGDYDPADDRADFLSKLAAWRDAAVAADRERLRARLAEALDGFYLIVRSGSGRQKGQVADPAEVADALHATLSRIAVETGKD